MSRPNARPALAALAAALLAGCFSIGGERAELAVYGPRVDLRAAADVAPLDRTLAVGEPNASTALDSNRIAVRPEPSRLQVYAGAIWSDHAPALVQSALVDALGDSGRFRAVVRPTDSVAADLLLRLDLTHFEAIYADDAKRPTVVIELQATLVEQRSQRVLASRRFRNEQPSEREKLPQVVAAFEAGLSATATEMAPWLAENAATR